MSSPHPEISHWRAQFPWWFNSEITVPQIQHIDKIIDVPVGSRRRVLGIPKVVETVQVVQAQHMDVVTHRQSLRSSRYKRLRSQTCSALTGLMLCHLDSPQTGQCPVVALTEPGFHHANCAGDATVSVRRAGCGRTGCDATADSHVEPYIFTDRVVDVPMAAHSHVPSVQRVQKTEPRSTVHQHWLPRACGA